MLVASSPASYALELPQRRTYELSCLFIPTAGRIDLGLYPHTADPNKVVAQVHVAFSGLVGTLSGAREQKYTSILMFDSPTGVTGLHHRQEVGVDHAGKRIRYGWEWNRDEDKDIFVARRFWGGEEKQVTTLKGGTDVVSDILSLIFRSGADAYSSQSPEEQREYTLLDPEGNIRVLANFKVAEDKEPLQTRVRLEFSRNPLTLGASGLELWFNPAGEIMRGRISGIRGLLPLNFTPTE